MSRLPLSTIKTKQSELQQKLNEVTDPKQMATLGREYKINSAKYNLALQIEQNENIIVQNQSELDKLVGGGTSEHLEIREMIASELTELTELNTSLENQLLALLSPEDPHDDDDIFLEIRGGAGGDESSLFAGELYKSYSAWATSHNLKIKIISLSPGTVGGFKELIAEVRGSGAFALFKYEAGVHRVQRVPETEKQGRVHTSTISVAVMLLIESDSEFKLSPDDIEVTLSTSSGNGGQSVNTTYSAVKMKHKPTGIEAQSQDERDQQQNRAKALAVLTSRVWAHLEEMRKMAESAKRKEQVGSAGRSEKIRTYNFPQDRLTDHRYNKSWNQLPLIMSGAWDTVNEDIRSMEAENILNNL